MVDVRLEGEDEHRVDGSAEGMQRLVDRLGGIRTGLGGRVRTDSPGDAEGVLVGLRGGLLEAPGDFVQALALGGKCVRVIDRLRGADGLKRGERGVERDLLFGARPTRTQGQRRPWATEPPNAPPANRTWRAPSDQPARLSLTQPRRQPDAPRTGAPIAA